MTKPASKLTMLFQDDALHVYWHQEHGYFLADWQSVFRKGEALKRCYQACLDLAKTRRGAPWLADVSKVAVLDQDDQKWISDWFFPEFVRAGVRYQAAVSATKEVGRISTTAAARSIARSRRLEITAHDTRGEAETAIIAWREKHKDY
jgi:hypothetical protein